MEKIVDILIVLTLLCGLFFTVSGFVGMFRFKDTLSILQASTNITTLGIIFIILGAMIYGLKFSLVAFFVKGIFIIIFIIVTGPIGSHALARAYLKTLKKKELERDDYWRDMNE